MSQNLSCKNRHTMHNGIHKDIIETLCYSKLLYRTCILRQESILIKCVYQENETQNNHLKQWTHIADIGKSKEYIFKLEKQNLTAYEVWSKITFVFLKMRYS